MTAAVLILFFEVRKMKKIAIIGGDNRLKTVKNHLEVSGYTVDTLGLYENDNAVLQKSDIILLPVPTTKDGINVFTPLTGKKIPLKLIEENVGQNQTVLCCNYHFDGCNCIDYNRLDSYALLGAIPTAEGAIKLAIENTPITLWGARVLVIGYGRVGKVLADRLKGLCCNLTVSARKTSDFALLKALGIKHTDTRRLNSNPFDYDIVFNTVDASVLPDSIFENTPCLCIIDLSSKGGFSLEAARKNGIFAIKAPGLPGITAPKTAGEMLAITITELLNTSI